MKNLNLPMVSLEAIQYQGQSLLLFDIVSAIEAIRIHPTIDQRSIDQSKLADVIFHRTGMRTLVLALDDMSEPHDLACYAEPPLVDAANPYFKLLQGSGLYDAKKSILDRHQRALRMARDSLGWVDLKAGRVGGVFSSLVNRLFISTELLRDAEFTSQEIAAILIHENGHLFSYYETMAYATASNMVIVTAVEALQGMATQSDKIQLITQSLSAFGPVSKDAVDAIATEGQPTAQRALFLMSMEEAEQNRVRTIAADHRDTYNARSIEFMADQFAVRHGAAVPLASAHHKMAKRGFPDYGRGKTAFYSVQACRMALLGLTFLLPGGLIIGSLMTFTVSLLCSVEAIDGDSNSDPSERIAQMKVDLVQLLKNTKLDPKVRKQLLNDVDAINAIREEIKENSGIFRFIWRNVHPTGRRQAKIRDFQKGLEELVTNDLFIHANRLRAV